jgi:Protein of unknown function (DUF1552)
MKSLYSRRHVLRAAGLTLALPFAPAYHSASSNTPKAKRFVGITSCLGFYKPNLIPKNTGIQHDATPYLDSLQAFRGQYSIFSGLEHPGVADGHFSEVSIFTGAPHPASASFKNTISLDQQIANSMGNSTRYPSLSIATSSTNRYISYNENGKPLPVEIATIPLFEKLFFSDSSNDQQKIRDHLNKQKSILDFVKDSLKRIDRASSADEREILDQYLTSIRELEVNLKQQSSWVEVPKPKVTYKIPAREQPVANIIERLDTLFNLIQLALANDSSRSIVLKIIGYNNKPNIEGVDESYHGLSHHGMDPEKIEQLTIIEKNIIDSFSRFITKLNDTKDNTHANLLNSTVVMLNANLGNASSHNTTDLPLLVAGGNFKHVGHQIANQTPLANAYLSTLHQLGIETNRFASSQNSLLS